MLFDEIIVHIYYLIMRNQRFQHGTRFNLIWHPFWYPFWHPFQIHVEGACFVKEYENRSLLLKFEAIYTIASTMAGNFMLWKHGTRFCIQFGTRQTGALSFSNGCLELAWKLSNRCMPLDSGRTKTLQIRFWVRGETRIVVKFWRKGEEKWRKVEEKWRKGEKSDKKKQKSGGQ